jgi:transcriptional regulator with AAA-type ATPase domain
MAKRSKKTTDLEYWLGGSIRPVFVLDAERRIAAVSAGFESLTGWGPGDVQGVACHYGSVSEIAGAAALAASICPPPEVFGGREASAPACLIHQDGSTLSRMLHFFPLSDEKGNQRGVLGIVGDTPGTPGGDIAVPPRYELHAELAALQAKLRSQFGSQTIVARSMAMRRVLGQLQIALGSSAAVLFSGAPGTGKEHLARVVHFSGPGRAGAFVSLDCRRLGPEELNRVWARVLESRRMAATSSNAAPLPGTVFLSDVEYLPRDLQERLVAALAEPAPLRLLASTNVSPEDFARHENLRHDFHALVSPLTIELPPLSRRPDDIPVLAQHFLEECNRQEQKQMGGFDEQVWPLFARYAWPQNLDELAAVVAEGHLHAADSVIRPGDLPFRFRNALSVQELPPAAASRPLLLDPLLTKVEAQLIGLALKRCRNNRSKAAELLGITRARLLRRIEQLHIGDDRSGEPEVEPETRPEEEPPDDLTEP